MEYIYVDRESAVSSMILFLNFSEPSRGKFVSLAALAEAW